jgi:hypothetical protein
MMQPSAIMQMPWQGTAMFHQQVVSSPKSEDSFLGGEAAQDPLTQTMNKLLNQARKVSVKNVAPVKFSIPWHQGLSERRHLKDV